MTWAKSNAPSAGSIGQFVRIDAVSDVQDGVDFQLRINQYPAFYVASDSPARISSTTILEP